MTGFLYRVGRFCARHHYPVIAAWIVLAIAIGLVGKAVGTKNSDNLSIPGTQSTLAQNQLKEDLPSQAYGTNPIVMQAGKGAIGDAANKQIVADTVKRLRSEPGVVSAVDPFSAAGTGSVSKSGTTAYISVTLAEGPSDLTPADAETILDATDEAKDKGFTVAVGGYLGQALSESDSDSSEAIGIAAAIVILLFAFGTVTAMALPIVTALVGLVISLVLIKLLGHVVDVPSVAPTLATMIGLGVGIDYALFLVTRHKLQLRDGMEIQESIARAVATSGGAVTFAGCTVVIALVSLLASGIPLVGTMGYSAAVAVVVAVLAALTLLPALLGALGPRINSLRVKIGKTHPDDHQPHGWRRFAERVSHRPWRSALASAAILIVLAIPVLNLQLGSTDNRELPGDTTARQAYDIMAAEYGPGINGPLLVAVRLPSPAKGVAAEGGSPASDPRLTSLEAAIAKAKGVKGVSPAIVGKNGTGAALTVSPTTGPTQEATERLVDDLRDDVIPKNVAGKDMKVYVGGQTAGYIDLADKISDKLPQMILIVVGLSCILLLVAFRSILLPLKAAVCNLLSVGAAYGIVTFVFQEGHGAKLLGLEGAVPIASYVPLLMFAILFGLSMDYEVFLLSQIQEHYEEMKDTRKAVVEGLATTGRVITSAALIMVCVFGSFLFNGNVVVKQFGLGLAAAIAIDATIVRCLFVPAVMTLMGDRCWWLPKWLDRILPKMSVEGGEYFREREAKEAAVAAAPTPVPERV